VGLKNRTILDTIPAPAAAYDLIETIEMVYLFYGAVLGVICGLSGLVGFLLMAICAKIGETVCQQIDRLGLGTFREEQEQEEDDSKTPRTYLGMIVTPTLGGCLIGLLAVACPLTLGDGSAQLNVILGNAETLGSDTLIVSAIVKLVAVSISLGFGFIGGQVFPLLFTGACIGAAAHVLVPEVPLLISFPACMTATSCAFLPLTFTFTTAVSLAIALGGPATSPVFVAAVCSFTVVCGFGFLQGMLKKAMATKQSRAS
jgi:H+/Cl- antiporter ClcA